MTVPHPHGALQPSPSQSIQFSFLSPSGHILFIVGQVLDFVFAKMRIQHTLRAEHPQTHVQVARIGSKQRGQFIHIASRRQGLVEHTAHVQHGNDP